MTRISKKKSIEQLIKFIIGKSISSLGNSIYNFGISFFILSKTGSAKLFSLNLAIMIFIKIIITPLSGYIADLKSKKTIIIFSQFGQSLFMLILLLIIYLKGFSIISIFITNMGISFLNSLATPSLNSAIPNIVHSNHLQKINAFHSMSNSIASLVGPVIGGVAYAFVNEQIFIILFIIGFIIAGLIDMSIDFNLFKKPEQDSPNPKTSVYTSFNYGLKYIKKDIVIFRLITLSMILNFFSGIILIGISKIIIDHFKASSYDMGILETSFGIGIFIGSIIIGTVKKIKRPFFVIKFSLLLHYLIYISIGIIIFVFNDFTVVYFSFYVLSMLLGGSITFINTPMFVYFQENISENIRGRVFSIIELIAQLLTPLSYIIFGVLFDIGFYPLIFLLSGIICLLLVMLLLNSNFLKMQQN